MSGNEVAAAVAAGVGVTVKSEIEMDNIFYRKLLRWSSLFFLAATAFSFWAINNSHVLREHEFSIQIFLSVIFGLAATLITCLAIVLLRAIVDTFFKGKGKVVYWTAICSIFGSNLLVDVPLYLIFEKYHFIPKGDVFSRILLAISFGGCMVFLGFIGVMVIAAVVGFDITFHKKQAQE